MQEKQMERWRENSKLTNSTMKQKEKSNSSLWGTLKRWKNLKNLKKEQKEKGSMEEERDERAVAGAAA